MTLQNKADPVQFHQSANIRYMTSEKTERQSSSGIMEPNFPYNDEEQILKIYKIEKYLSNNVLDVPTRNVNKKSNKLPQSVKL